MCHPCQRLVLADVSQCKVATQIGLDHKPRIAGPGKTLARARIVLTGTAIAGRPYTTLCSTQDRLGCCSFED